MSDVPHEHTVARACKPSDIDENEAVLGAAFLLAASEDGVSVDWIERLDCITRFEAIQKIIATHRAVNPNVKRTRRLALVNVYDAIDEVNKKGLALTVVHDPVLSPPALVANDAHALMRVDPVLAMHKPNEVLIGEAIACRVHHHLIFKSVDDVGSF